MSSDDYLNSEVEKLIKLIDDRHWPGQGMKPEYITAKAVLLLAKSVLLTQNKES